MKNLVYERKVKKSEEFHRRIFGAARRINDPDVLHKIQIILNFI